MKTTNKLNSRKIFFIEQNDFHQQNEFETEFESMEVNEMNKCLSKFYVSVRRKDGSFYNLKTSLLLVRAALGTGSAHKRRVCLYVRNIKKCMGILKGIDIVNFI